MLTSNDNDDDSKVLAILLQPLIFCVYGKDVEVNGDDDK